jgi:hypothetical protein
MRAGVIFDFIVPVKRAVLGFEDEFNLGKKFVQANHLF